MTGKKRRWLNPTTGLLKLAERAVDRVASRYIYPHVKGIWTPYSWQLPRRFALAETNLCPQRWPNNLPPLRVLLLSDIHTGPFLKPEVLSTIVTDLMALRPDLVVIAGDIVTGHSSELDNFLAGLAVLSEAPLGAWFCLGNHDHFSGDPEGVQERLESIGISTLRNQSVVLTHGDSKFVLGGIDDLILGTPDWDQLLATNGSPDLLLAHNPDLFYEAEARGAALMLSGHTHGGQIRFRDGPPLVRHSSFSLDEGAYSYGSSLLVVSRGLGAVGLPWRIPEWFAYLCLLFIHPRASPLTFSAVAVTMPSCSDRFWAHSSRRSRRVARRRLRISPFANSSVIPEKSDLFETKRVFLVAREGPVRSS